MDLALLLMEVDETHEDVRHELGDDDLGEEWLALSGFGALKGLLDRNHSLQAAAVHVLHDQVDHAVVVKDAVVLDLHISSREHTVAGIVAAHEF